MSRKIIPIRGDGNCLFRSISYCVHGSQEMHQDIRARIVDHVVEHWSRYRDFIIGDRSYGLGITKAADYRRLMSRHGEYGGHVELCSASEVYTEYTFKVHVHGGARTIDYGRGRTSKHLLFSGFLDAGHYSVLE